MQVLQGFSRGTRDGRQLSRTSTARRHSRSDAPVLENVAQTGFLKNRGAADVRRVEHGDQSSGVSSNLLQAKLASRRVVMS
jgi:hypothetical protein